MELRNTIRTIFFGNLYPKERPQRTLPIYFPIIWIGRLLKKGFKKIWQSILGSILLFVLIFLGLFYVVNLDIRPTQKKSTVMDQSFAGSLLNADLKNKIGSTDVSTMAYFDWAVSYGLNTTNGKYDDDPDGDGLPNYLEYAYGTNPTKADSDGDGYSDKQEITNGYDPDAPGDARPNVTVSISKIGIDAPMVWSNSEDEESLDKDLKNGIVHYPKMAAPGQAGNMIITGHSSNYIWAAGNYNHIFKDLNNLTEGDTIDIKTVEQNGRVLTFHYKVSGKRITSADDPTIFDSGTGSVLTIATCWPIGTNLKRLIVTADLLK